MRIAGERMSIRERQKSRKQEGGMEDAFMTWLSMLSTIRSNDCLSHNQSQGNKTRENGQFIEYFLSATFPSMNSG